MPFTPDQSAPKSSFTPDDSPQEPSLMDKLKSLGGNAVGAMNTYHNALVRGVTGGLVDPNKIQDKIYGGTGFQDTAKEHGTADTLGDLGGNLALGGAEGEALKAIPQLAGKGFLKGLARTAASGAVGAGTGAVQDGERGAVIGGLSGLAGAGAGELIGGSKAIPGKLAGLKYANQREAYLDAPKEVSNIARQIETKQFTPELSDASINAINQSRQGLKRQGLGQASKLSEILNGKSIEINPHDFQDTPEARQLIKDNFVQPAPGKTAQDLGYVDLPDKMSMDAGDANKLKRMYQSNASYKPGHVNDPVQDARNAAMQAKGSQLKSAIEGLDPSIKGLNEDMQRGMMLQKDLRGGLKKPIAYVSSDAPDRAAILARSDKLAPPGNLTQFSDKVSAGKALAQSHSPSSIFKNITEVLREHGALPAMRAMDATGKAAPGIGTSLAALLSHLVSSGDEKK